MKNPKSRRQRLAKYLYETFDPNAMSVGYDDSGIIKMTEYGSVADRVIKLCATPDKTLDPSASATSPVHS